MRGKMKLILSICLLFLWSCEKNNTNKQFNNESFTLEIKDGAKLDCNRIKAIAGDKNGSNITL